MAVLIGLAFSDILPGMGEAYSVLVVVDGLRADALGSYGNPQAATPFLDRLSSESTLYDSAFVLDPTLDGFYSAAMLGIHPCYRHAGTGALPRRTDRSPLAEMGSHYLFTEDPAVAEIAFSQMDWTDACTHSREDRGRAESGDSKAFFQSAADWLNEQLRSAPTRVCAGWVHTSVHQGHAPIESRKDYDTLVTQLDEGIHDLFSELSFPEETSGVLFIVMGARGYALGEHGEAGTHPPVLHEEMVHVPLMVYCMEQRFSPLRIASLISPIDVGVHLSAWLQKYSGATPTPTGYADEAWPRKVGAGVNADCLVLANSLGDVGIRTPGWYLIRTAPTDGQPSVNAGAAPQRLFLKPDDRWEFNEVSSLRPEVVQMLGDYLDGVSQQACAGEPLSLPPLPPELLKGS